MSDQLADLVKGLHPRILEAHVRWSQFLVLFTVSGDRMKFIYGIAPWFFRLLQDTFRDDAFIALSRLTDKSTTAGKPNLTLVSLVETAEARGLSSVAVPARALLDQLLAKVQSIREWRDKWLAHIDLSQALASKPLPTAKVQRGDIDEALRLTREIMALFSAHLGKSRFGYDSVIILGGAEDLLRALNSP